MENPFKFGTIVEEKYFTDRVEEVAYIEQFMKSVNHLVLISPRRFGKSSVVAQLPRDDFHRYLSDRLAGCYAENHAELADRILDYTSCHPYYSQQLAANVWQIGVLQPATTDPLQKAIDHIVTTHGLDYERLWMNFNRTNKWILQRLASKKPLQSGEYRTSTIYSALKRLQKDGYVIYSDHYELEDPFFKEWILDNNN